MFEFLGAKLRCTRISAKWFSMSSGDFFDEMLKMKLQLYLLRVIFYTVGIMKKRIENRESEKICLYLHHF